MKTKIFLLLTFVCTCTNFIVADSFDTWQTLYTAKVLRIIDGDTIEIRFDDDVAGCDRLEKVRLIGIDTPEIHGKKREYFGKEASDFTTNMLLGQNIYIEFDESGKRDYFGRLLAFVRLSNNKDNQQLFKDFCDVNSISSALNSNTFLFNEAIILAGYATYYDKYPFFENYMTRFESAEEMAEVLERGIWE